MSHEEGDVERAPNTERTPLLNGAHAAESAQNDRDSDDATLLDQPPQPQRTAGWYLWRAFWVVLGALVLAVFIKGWIDADDVNVRDPLTLCAGPARRPPAAWLLTRASRFTV